MPRTFTIEETINLPRTEVWQAIQQPEAWHHAIKGIESIKRLDEPPTRLGTRYEETRTLDGRTETFIVEVTEFEPEAKYAGSVFYHGAEFRYTYTFNDIPNQPNATHATMHASVIPHGLLAKTIMRPMLGMAIKMMKKHDADQLTRLKAALESQQTPIRPEAGPHQQHQPDAPHSD